MMVKQACTVRFTLFCVCFVVVWVLTYRYTYHSRSTYVPGYLVYNKTLISQNYCRSNSEEHFKQGRCFRLSWNLSQEFETMSGPRANLKGTLYEFPQHIMNSNICHVSTHGDNVEQKTCRLFLTKSKLIGRIGNQLFQYSSLIGMSCEFDYIPILTRSASTLQKYFEIPNILNSQLSDVKTIKCIGGKYAKHYNCSSYLKNQTEGIFDIPGYNYLQSWKYFSKCSSVIKQALQLKQQHIHNARDFLSTNAKGWNTTVCIHVRRGDMTEKRLHDIGYTTANESYIYRAQHYFEQLYKSVIFIVLSDDISWCKHKLKGNIIFSPFNNPGDDMALMLSCDHVIVTAGTFGWWGAWLSGGTTVYFKQFVRENSSLSDGMVLIDYYPPHWIPM